MPSNVSRLGPYKVREKLSEGAITTLYRAEHERLGRVVIIKALKGTLAKGSPLGTALAKEATILGKLDHTSIASVFDFAVDETSAWMALEDVSGPRLRAVLERAKRLEPTVAMAIALSIAEGLGHGHTRGIVVREVRPEGVVITPEGRCVLVDLGAALDLSAPPSPSQFDGSERLSGPEYAAPEQIVGEPCTPRSDVFVLGILLYEMLTSGRPWDEGVDGVKEGVKEIARRVRSEDPPPLGQRGVPASPALERIIWRCLAKRPEDRYEDGNAAAAALSEALDELTSTSAKVLVTRALARALLGEEIEEAKARRKPIRRRPPMSLKPLVQRLVGLLGLIVVGVVVIEIFMRDEGVATETEANAESAQRGQLRVLARPWAEVLVDGRFVDVTPIGRPIPVVPGRHYVTFKHPNAPDEKREIRVASGQTVVLDVTMRIERLAGDAGAPPVADAADSP